MIFIKLKIKRISLFSKCDELALALLRIKRTSSSREIFADFWVPHEIKSCDFQNLLVFGFPEASHHLDNFYVSEHAEADCFFCFTNLMSDIRDFFIKTLDEAESGINGMMLRFYRKIKSIDAKVEARLVDQDIKPQYFSFRYVCM